MSKISIIYPIYNESKHILNDVFKSCYEAIEDEDIEVIFVNDGSENKQVLIDLHKQYFKENKNVELIHQINQGKREAQANGLQHSTGQYIITVDSDTIINKQSLYYILEDLLFDDKVGASTGNVLVSNDKDNLLTTLIALRYWLSFNLERASQGFNGAVLCCCGSFTVYRRNIFEQVLYDYTNQYFKGVKCTFGDDRHLSNLFLGAGYKITYNNRATAYTHVPNTIKQYITQQTRWTKSFFREMLWTFKFKKNIHWFSLVATIIQPILLILLIFSYSNSISEIVLEGNLMLFLRYSLIVIIITYLRALFGFIILKDWRFILLPFYTLLNIFVLIPIKLKATLTMTDSKWGTRGDNNNKKGNKINVFLDLFKYQISISFIILIIIYLIRTFRI